MSKTYPLYNYRTGERIADYTFGSEPHSGDRIQLDGVGSPIYTIVRCWEVGELVLKLQRPGMRQVSRDGSR